MTSPSLDDPGVLAAMRAYLEACQALDGASTDSDVLERAEVKSMAGMVLRQRLTEAGWTAPTRQRSST